MVTKELDYDSWGWFIDIESNEKKEDFLNNKEKFKMVNNFENYNSTNCYIIVFNMIGIVSIIYIMFSILKI